MMSYTEQSIRPLYFDEFLGQDQMIANLKVFIEASQLRGDILDHCILYGPPGLGKTTLAKIIANALGSQFISLSALGIEHTGDLIAVLSDLQTGDILFIDEIHRLSKSLQETLYTIMEDFYIDIIIGKEQDARSVRLEIEPFILIGATTQISQLTAAFLDRFGIHCKFDYYAIEDIQGIITRNAQIEMCNIERSGIIELSKRSRGTPRLANRYFKRIRDFAKVAHVQSIDGQLVKKALDQLHVDASGLNQIDLLYLEALVHRFGGGPVGVGALASMLALDVNALEQVYEPYLLQIGMIQRTPRGRLATDLAYQHLGLKKPFV